MSVKSRGRRKLERRAFECDARSVVMGYWLRLYTVS